MLRATLLLLTTVNASDLSDGGLEVGKRSAQAQQDNGRDDYLDGRLQKFAETTQNGRDYDSAQVEDYNSPLADQMDEFAGMEQESDDGSDKEENMADLEQDSEEGGTDQDLSDMQQNDGDSYNEAELEQDEVGNDGKLDSFPQQIDDGGEEEKLDSLFQQTGVGEDGGNMEQDTINQQTGDGEDEGNMEQDTINQQIGDDGNENNEELEAILQQVDDGEANRDIKATAAQNGGGDEGNANRGTATAQWNNQLDGPLKIKCPAGSGLYSVYSYFSRKKKDRLFNWRCKRVGYLTEDVYVVLILNNDDIRLASSLGIFSCPNSVCLELCAVPHAQEIPKAKEQEWALSFWPCSPSSSIY